MLVLMLLYFTPKWLSFNLDMYKKTEAAILNFQAKNPVTQIRGSDYEEFPLADFD